MKAADLFVQCLENEGVEYVFGIGGEENLYIIEALRKSKIKFVPVRHEQGGAFMAATVGRLTGKPGVAITSIGAGVTNYTTAIAYAQLGAMPLITINGQKPIKHQPQAKFQIIDVIGIVKPITKFAHQVVSGNTIASWTRKAFRIASEERPGAVHLEIPEDISKEEVTTSPLTIAKVRRPIADPKAIDWAVEMLENAKHPIIMIGAGANRKLVSKMLTEFVDKTGIPFFNTQLGKGVIDERHPLFLGTAALSAKDYVHCAIGKADVILSVGHDIYEKPGFLMKDVRAKVIDINFYASEIDEVYFPDLEVQGDIANAIWQIKEKIKISKKWDFSYFQKVKNSVDNALQNKIEDSRYPLTPQRIIADLRKIMPDGGILALDNGMYKFWFARQYPAYQRQTLLLDNHLATMGAGLPSAIAAKLIYPDRKVMAVCGDGGFMMNSQELETAVRLGIDLVVLIINDNGFGIIKWKQKNYGLENFGLEFGNPDFPKLAESYGAKGYKVSSAEEFASTMKKCLDSKGVHLVECPVDYSENFEVFDKELKDMVCPN